MDALSDQLFVVTLLSYAAGMLGYAAAYLLRPQHATATALAQVGAASAEPSAIAHRGPGTTPTWQRHEWAALAGAAATVIGAAAHTACLIARASAAGRVPWGTMYEFVVLVTLVGVLAWLWLAVRRPSARPLGLYVTLAALVLLGAAGMRLHTPAGPLVPALKSTWLAIHVSAAAVASGIFLTGFVAAVAHLLRARYDARLAAGTTTTGLDDTLAARLPTASALERHAFRLHAVAFPIWTFAVIAGAIWAEAAWGRYWGWDPKETWAFISWIVYAGYLHARATPSMRRTTTAWIAVAGWATMMFNLFAVNLVISGLHSYAGTG